MSVFTLAWKERQREAHQNSIKHGWWQDECNNAEKIALMHAELSEALEYLRKGKNIPSDHISEFLGIEEEYADVIIRIMDHAEYLGLHVAEAIEAKMAYNATRPMKHGGKLF